MGIVVVMAMTKMTGVGLRSEANSEGKKGDEGSSHRKTYWMGESKIVPINWRILKKRMILKWLLYDEATTGKHCRSIEA